MKTITLKSGITLGYNEFGSGGRYLLAASQFINSKIHYTIDLAKEGFHVFQIRIRGYAPSTEITEDLGEKWYDTWAQDICDFADAMEIDTFFYTGVSHGAGIGWYLSLYHQERLRGFFCCVGGPHSKDGEDTGAARMMTINASQSPETWKAYIDKKIPYRTAGYQKMVRDGKYTQAEADEAVKEQYDWWMAMPPRAARYNPKKPFPFCKTEEELIKVLSQSRVPTLMIGGMQDDISTAENMVRSCRAVKNSKLVIYEDGTHAVMQEYQTECVRDIVNFTKDRGLW